MTTNRDTTPTANEPADGPVPTRPGSGPRLALLPAVPRSVLTTERASWRSVAEQRTVPLPPQPALAEVITPVQIADSANGMPWRDRLPRIAFALPGPASLRLPRGTNLGG